MEINVGDYVRFKKETYVDYLICKIVKIDYNASFQFCCTRPLVYFDKIDSIYLDELKEMITKHSKNIIDLIEEDDYIRIITSSHFDYVYMSYGKLVIRDDVSIENYSNKFIAEVLTKEQIKANAYKIEKER